MSCGRGTGQLGPLVKYADAGGASEEGGWDLRLPGQGGREPRQLAK